MDEKLNLHQRGRIIIIFREYFKSFLDEERAILGNKLYTFSSNARRVFLKDLLGKKLNKRDLEFKEEHSIKNFD
ncbi:MAG: hypothetical protein AABY22_31375 [Nanoarchaeota archaeon]